MADGFSQNARRFFAAPLSRNGSDGGRRNATLASSLHGRRPGGFARVDGGADASGGRSRSDLEFRQRLSPARFRFRIVLLGVGHAETLVDELTRFIFSSHLRVNPSELDIVHEAVRVDRD